MKPKDPDTFIDIGVSITRLLLIASGQGMAASLIGEGAGLLKDLGNLGSGGRRAVSAEKIADEVADQLFREHQGISEADWQVAATNVAPLIDRLSEKDRLAAGYDWTALCPVLLELGGAERRRKLADESARRAFDRVLDVACQRIADLFTEKEALASLLEKVDGVQSGVQQLLNRPAGASKTRDIVIEHIKALRDLAPDRLEDRESEMTDLEAFVRSSDDVWYAMEADMVSGKTAVMASFALNPPDDVHMVSFFIRRIGGDGSDRGSFAFVMGAQLAKILGHEYTEPVRDPAQHTEFRQMLRRAATACRSEATPRTLVLLIDGIDEDSYFENPDGADAKSILSLLPRRLPEGVKIITASRPNPRLPEDVLCDADRRIVSLKPSPIAEKSINRKDMKIFFKSDVAVDIGAFLAACGGVLTVEDLRRLLTMRGYQRTRTWDVREYVDRSPGRILTPVDVGFGGQKVLAYRLGHDVVTRAVIRELDSDSFGEGDEPEDERWWAPIREKALAPYGAIIRDWVKEYASRGWGGSTPSYVLSGACFDLMLNDKKDGGSSVRVVLDRGRYDEMRRQSGRRSYVLRMIDRECFTILDMNRGELPEDATTSIFEVAESRSLFVRMSAYVPGLPGLHVSHFNATPDVVLDMILSIDEPKSRLDALRETTEAAINSGRGYAFLPILPVVLESLGFYRDLRDRVLRLLVDVFVHIDSAVNELKTGDNGNVNLRDWFSEVLVCINAEDGLSRLLPSFENVDGLGKGAHSVSLFLLIAEGAAERIKGSWARAWALVRVVGVLARAGEINRARRVAESAVSAADQIKDFRERTWALVGVAGVLARAGEINRARRVAESAVSAADQIKDPQGRAQALVKVADALVRAGQIDEALDVAERVKDPQGRARALVKVADALVRAGQINRARRVAESAMGAADQIKDFRERARALVGVADALTKMGEVNMVRRVAESAMGAADQIKDFRGRAWALVGVAGALAKMGEVNMVRRVAESAVSAADQIKDPQGRAWALVGAADVLARAGQINEALDMAERVKDPQGRMRVLMGVVSVLAQTGETNRIQRVAEDAVNTAVRVEESKERAQALAGVVKALARAGAIDEVREIVTMINEPSSRSRAQSVVIKALVGKGSSDEAVNMLRVALAEVEGLVRRQDAADYCATLAAACLDAADLVDAESTTHEQWLGLSRSTLARSWLYGASVWDRFDVLLRVVPDLATRLVEERLLVEPESAGPASSVDPTDRADPEPRPGPGPGPEGPGGGTPSSR